MTRKNDTNPFLTNPNERIFLGLGLALSFILCGCARGGQSCNSACPSGTVCVNAICMNLCSGDDDCDLGENCANNVCQLNDDIDSTCGNGNIEGKEICDGDCPVT
ncbi:MAG: hypothetical protein R3C68_03135 [Myxococcota bacterium]